MLYRQFLPWLLLLGTSLAQAPPCTTAAVTPPPAGYHCGDQGTVKTADIYSTATTVDSTACRSLCYAAKAKCLSFSFNTANHKCTLATGNVVNQGFKKSTTSNTYYWNRAHCFKVTCPTCPSGQNYCSSLQQCTNLNTDANNCGTCDKKCPSGQVCSGGSCACPTAGQSLCGASCTDTLTDSNNCGTCGNSCPSGQECSGGSCACSTAGESLCSGTCLDLQTDANNCGTCGNSCPSGSICSGGSCSCPIFGQSLCGSSCTDTLTDSDNCGTCGTSCPSDQECSGGSCACSTAGQSLCGGSCFDTSSDADNCGICGNACPSAQTCSGGSCSCPIAGQTLCGDSCYDTSSDADNCGTCGNACPAGSICAGGSCSCPITGQTLCGDSCLDTSSDQNNCGTCGNACPSAANCVGGTCSCPTPGETLCGDSCLDTSSDPANCGACGNYCYSDETCVQGSCKSCYGQSGNFQLQAANVQCGYFDGGYPYYIGNDGKGDSFAMDYGLGPSVSPVFYIQYSGKPAADGTCSGSLIEVVTGSEVQVGFTDPADIGDYIVTFNKAGNVPTTNAILLNCYVDSTTNKLICSENGQSGYWFACCSRWRWAPAVAEDCGSFDLVVVPH